MSDKVTGIRNGGQRFLGCTYGLAALLLAACTQAPAAPAPTAPASKPAATTAPATDSKPAATQPATASKAGDQAEWDRLVAAAKQEGRVSIVTAPGEPYRQVFDSFEKQFGISVELLAGQGNVDLVPKINTERQAGQYQWDVVVHSPTSLFNGFKPAGALDPLRPALVRADVLDDSKWIGGFDAGYKDTTRSQAYAFVSTGQWTVWVNRSLIPESEFSKLDQLWDPKWAGRVAIQDPTVPSAGAQVVATWLVAKSEESVRAVLRDTRPTLTRDRRQLAEWLVRGTYPIAIGIEPSSIASLASQGLDVKQVAPLVDDDLAAPMLSYGTGAVGLVNRAPHQNAAKVLINWLLSQEGQTLYSQLSDYNSRRTDVPVVDKVGAIDAKRRYVDTTTEEASPTYGRALAIAGEVLK